MNLYYILYRSSEGDERKSYVVASTLNLAWSAIQANDPQAQSIESSDEVEGNVLVGS